MRVRSENDVEVPIPDAVLRASVGVPRAADGVVLFAHGSGSGRMSPRNRAVARALQEAGLGTVLLDLLTEEEAAVDARTAEYRFDIPLLASRLTAATAWAPAELGSAAAAVGYFGASTGAAAALIAAAALPDAVRAVVSRGGRPDLAGDALEHVRAPTLLIVGGRDESVIELNRQAMARMRTEVSLEVVPGATHLFEEPGALEDVAALASAHLRTHLAA